MREAMRRAVYEPVKDGTIYAHIPGFEGLWVNAQTVEDARTELWEVLDSWLYVRAFVSQLPPPSVGDLQFEPPSRLEK